MLIAKKQWLVYLLLLLLPLQSLAAASMLICNSFKQLNDIIHNESPRMATEEMPCHATMDGKQDTQPVHKKDTKNYCGIMCGSLLAASVTPGAFQLSVHLNKAPHVVSNAETYISVSLPKLQRPPIFLA